LDNSHTIREEKRLYFIQEIGKVIIRGEPKLQRIEKIIEEIGPLDKEAMKQANQRKASASWKTYPSGSLA